MSLELRQVQALKQELRMTPQLKQAIELLQYNRQELAEFLKEQMEENPALERRIDEILEQPSSSSAEERSDDSLEEATNDIDWENYLANDDAYQTGTSGRGTAGYQDLPSIEQTHAEEPDLSAHLLQQLLERLDTTESEEEIAYAIVFSLDEQGYFRDVTIEELANSLEVEPWDVEDALALVQGFEPTGVAARNLSECLYLQAVERWPRDRMLKDIIRYHLEDIEAGSDAAICTALNITAEELSLARQRLQQLNPLPARPFIPDNEQSEYITPDVHVVEDDGQWKIQLNDENLPQMKIASYYKKTLQGQANSDAKAYVREKLNSASFLIRSIEQRRRTIRRVSQAIVDVQADYFASGPRALKPLILKDIAQIVGMHESTISRVTQDKYMDTPRGTLPMKYFFNAAIPLQSGGEISSAAVRFHVGELIKSEKPTKPYSDSALTQALLKRHDVKIARRTIAKYREAMNIPSSTKRRVRH